ncbi:MAG: carotenoid biosynthesis protein [Halobacteriales archaeon]
MTDPVFVANAVMSLAALGACAWHAAPDRDRLAFLAAGVVYGVILEQLVIVAFDAYHYNAADFLLTLGDVPLVIGFGWAAIIYAGFEIARAFDLSTRARPPFVALFALHIDLAIDAVAIRVPFWTWTPPGVWFGVPLGNFTGWFLVALLFPAAWLALCDRLSSRLLLAPAVLVSAVLALVVLLEGWTTFVETTPLKVVVLGTALLVSLAVVLRGGPAPGPIDPRITAVPALYHGFYLALLVGFRMYESQPAILLVSLAMVGLSLLLHVPGLRGVRQAVSAA